MTQALEEYVQRRKQARILDLFLTAFGFIGRFGGVGEQSEVSRLPHRRA